MSISRQIKAFILRKLTSKKSHNFDIHKAENVLFLRYDRIGDMVITTPVFREIKLVYPHIKITVIASTANQDVLTNNPYVDNIITNHKNNLLSDLSSLLKLRKQKFDVCIEFDHSVIPHAIIRLKVIKPKKVISVKKDGRYGVDGSELLMYDFYTEKPSNAHFRDIWLATLKPFGVKPKSNVYDLFITDTQQKQAQNFIKQYSSKFLVGINLEGAVKGKKIKFSELWQICQGLHKANNNIQVIILTTPGNLQSIYEKVTESSLDYVVTSYKTDTILDAAALISQLDLIITPDTSIVHIASAFNKPVVTIHENNQDSYQLFSPVSNLNKTVFSPKKSTLEGYDIQKVIKYSNELIDQLD
ncbi:MAG TPA: lipopolysaccharide heptosyltransferase family protein [Candidatus Marinimicrobia bacterium]|nr:lipopolysaccharide heptosyltransferase family protein [Candidatus Neomarinimicrobiota bacterium]